MSEEAFEFLPTVVLPMQVFTSLRLNISVSVLFSGRNTDLTFPPPVGMPLIHIFARNCFENRNSCMQHIDFAFAVSFVLPD